MKKSEEFAKLCIYFSCKDKFLVNLCLSTINNAFQSIFREPFRVETNPREFQYFEQIYSNLQTFYLFSKSKSFIENNSCERSTFGHELLRGDFLCFLTFEKILLEFFGQLNGSL
jgi:hypothetical protein